MNRHLLTAENVYLYVAKAPRTHQPSFLQKTMLIASGHSGLAGRPSPGGVRAQFMSYKAKLNFTLKLCFFVKHSKIPRII